MDWNTVFFASYEIILSIVFSLVTIFITKKIVDKIVIKEDHSQKDNIALAIFTGTIIVSILILVNSSVLPAVDTLRVMVLANETITFKMVTLSFLYFLLYFSIAIFFSTIILLSALWVFFQATRWVDEMKELKSKNVAVSIVVSMAMLGIALFVQPALNRFIGSLIHYEKFESQALEQEEPHDDELVAPLEQIEPKN